jgi:hypothetical protein
MPQTQSADRQHQTKPHSRIKGWAALLFGVFLIWTFVYYIAPWIQNNVPVMKELTKVVKEQDIDTTAFFYTETKESYEAERYLRESFDLTKPEGYGFNGFFVLGIVFCIAILMFGYRFLPNHTNPDPDKKSISTKIP